MTRFGLDQYARFLLDPFSLQVLGATLWLGVEVTALTLLLGLPLALLLTWAPARLRGLLTLIVLLPLLTSVVVRTFAWIVILGRQGIVNASLLALGLTDTPLKLLYTEGGLVLALAQVQMPLMVLPLVTALSRIDPNLADASAALGAGAWRTFLRVTLPLCLPGIVAGCLLTFAAAITAFITQSVSSSADVVTASAMLRASRSNRFTRRTLKRRSAASCRTWLKPGRSAGFTVPETPGSARTWTRSRPTAVA